MMQIWCFIKVAH